MKKKKENLIAQKSVRDEHKQGAGDHGNAGVDETQQMLQSILKKLESHAHPYDDAFRTLKTYFTELLLPVLNEAFQEQYAGTEKVQLLDDHHFTGAGAERKKYETDAGLVVTASDGSQKSYLIECESKSYPDDYTVAIRLIRYSFMIATDQNSSLDGNILEIEIPSAMVIYLRAGSNQKNPMVFRIKCSDGILDIKAPVLKLADYTIDDIFEKKLYFLLPFYLLKKSKKELEKCQEDEESLEELLKELKSIQERLAAVLDKSFSLDEREKDADDPEKLLTPYTVKVIMELMCNIIAKAAKNYPKVQKGAMKVIADGMIITDTMREMFAAEERGRREGRKEGRNEGRKEGRRLGENIKLVSNICKKLRKAQTPEVIAEALEEKVDVVQGICEKINSLAPDYDEKKAYRLAFPKDSTE